VNPDREELARKQLFRVQNGSRNGKTRTKKGRKVLERGTKNKQQKKGLK
jgi:hypothetical protein